MPRTPASRTFARSLCSQLEQQRVQEYLAALEQALQMGTIDEAEFEEVRGRGGGGASVLCLG